MYTEDRSSDPFVADQLRKEKFRERQLSELQVGITLGKLEAFDYDIENVRLIHKRLAKTPEIAQRDFLQRAFYFNWHFFGKLTEKEFDFLSPCMDWKTLWERVNYLYGCECVELPINGLDDRPYYAFFFGHKKKPPIGLTPDQVRKFDRDNNLWLDWKLKDIDRRYQDSNEASKAIAINFTLHGEMLDEVLKIRDYHGYKTINEAFSKWLDKREGKNTNPDWRNRQT
jgi:hypothetical protein